MMYLLNGADFAREADNLNPVEHVVYMRSLATWAERAAETSSAMKVAMMDDQGDPTPEEALRSLVANYPSISAPAWRSAPRT